MKTREELQSEAVELLKEKKYLILSWSTGTGKTKPAIDAIAELKPKRVLLLVAETLHKKNWKEEFIKHGYGNLYNSITVACYASLHKYVGTEWDLLIADEAHHLGSELRLSYLSTIKFNYSLLLSATLSPSIQKKIRIATDKFFYNYKIHLQEAIDNEILPEPTIYLIPLYLDTKKYSEEIVENWGKANRVVYCTYENRWPYLKNRKTLYPNISLHIKCTQAQKYLYYCDQFNYWKKRFMDSRSVISKNKWLQAGSHRKDYLGSLKTPYVFKLLERIKDKRFICFCTNILQAEVLGRDNSIHSKKQGSQTTVDEFNSLKRNSIFAVGKAVEGVNLTGIEAGVIVQLDGKPLKYYQKSGRVYRSKNPEQYIFYYKNTRDEEFLKEALEGIDTKYIKEYQL